MCIRDRFVFSDLGTYKPNEWNVYTDSKEKLVRLGIPADEIHFIQLSLIHIYAAQCHRGHQSICTDSILRPFSLNVACICRTTASTRNFGV